MCSGESEFLASAYRGWISAICDIDEGHATRAQNMVEKATGRRPAPYTLGTEDYKRLLERQDVDAVLIMTTQDQHAQQAINAMKAGKHVGCEMLLSIVWSNVGSWWKPFGYVQIRKFKSTDRSVHFIGHFPDN